MVKRKEKNKKTRIIQELKEHIPFTALATLIAVTLTIILTISKPSYFPEFSKPLFEILHPAHVFFSAFATASLFYKYKKKIIATLLVGITGAISMGSLSDVILPWFETNLLSITTSFHLPLIEEPFVIIGIALIGSLTGIFLIKTKLPHLIHVLLSVFASLAYLFAFGPELDILMLFLSFFIVFIAVILPCCLSDIVFPLLFIKDKKQ